MKKLLIALLTVATISLGSARSASAQSFGAGSWDFSGLTTAVYITQGLIATGGLATGIGSSVLASRSEVNRGLFITTYLFGAANILGDVVAIGNLTRNPGSAPDWGFAIAHTSAAVLDVVAPTLGFVYGNGPRLTPVAVGGKDAGGRQWAGAGLRLSNF